MTRLVEFLRAVFGTGEQTCRRLDCETPTDHGHLMCARHEVTGPAWRVIDQRGRNPGMRRDGGHRA